MFNQTQKEAIINLIKESGAINKTVLVDELLKTGISKSKTPRQSYNRAIVQVLKSFDLEPIGKQKDKLIKIEDDEIKVITDEEYARDDFIDDIDEDDVWYKKILKTGKTSNPLWKTGLKIEIYTFEKNDKCRFESLLSAVMNKVPELSYIDNAGYSSTRDNYEGEISPYQFESAHLVVQSTEDSDFFNGAVALEDTNEMPC
jgi:hypothetical protein